MTFQVLLLIEIYRNKNKNIEIFDNTNRKFVMYEHF